LYENLLKNPCNFYLSSSVSETRGFPELGPGLGEGLWLDGPLEPPKLTLP
jgi:hypothetical protein